MQKDELSDSGQAVTIPNDWGLPGWDREHFERFNNARRKLHEVFQRGEKLVATQRAVSREQ